MNDAPLRWRKSSRSESTAACVEVARGPGGDVLVRNSNRPDAGTLAVPLAEMASWLDGCKAGQFDDLGG